MSNVYFNFLEQFQNQQTDTVCIMSIFPKFQFENEVI